MGPSPQGAPMRRTLLAAFLFPAMLMAQPAAAPTAIRPHAELKTGTAVEKMEIVGAADTTVTFVFSKGDRTSKQELKVPRSPYRTNAYRTFRAGDEGEWTV